MIQIQIIIFKLYCKKGNDWRQRTPNLNEQEMLDNQMQAMMDQASGNYVPTTVNQTQEATNEMTGSLVIGEEVDSLCTRDRNIRDALEHAKILQDATITSSLKAHTVIEHDGDGSQAQIMSEELLRNL